MAKPANPPGTRLFGDPVTIQGSQLTSVSDPSVALADNAEAVVIFGGLVSSTLLDTLLTPVMYWLFGEEATKRLIGSEPDTPQVATDAQEAY